MERKILEKLHALPPDDARRERVLRHFGCSSVAGLLAQLYATPEVMRRRLITEIERMLDADATTC